MAASTAKYGKVVHQLEKGLPPNGVVPLLKERVEDMREKVCRQGAKMGRHETIR